MEKPVRNKNLSNYCSINFNGIKFDEHDTAYISLNDFLKLYTNAKDIDYKRPVVVEIYKDYDVDTISLYNGEVESLDEYNIRLKKYERAKAKKLKEEKKQKNKVKAQARYDVLKKELESLEKQLK